MNAVPLPLPFWHKLSMMAKQSLPLLLHSFIHLISPSKYAYMHLPALPSLYESPRSKYIES